MNYLATLYPRVRRRQMPVSRDQAVLLMAAFNEIMLGLDTYLSHVLNHTIIAREWVPIIFGPVAGLILLFSGLIALRNRPLASWLATAVFFASMLVGLLGAYFHIVRGTLPSAPAGQRITLDLLVWAPPILAPLAFAGVGLLGLSAAWPEEPTGSGILLLPFRRRLQLPYSKTRAYFFMVSMGTLVALISSVFDHARQAWDNPSFWLPVAAGVFGTVTAAYMGGKRERPSRQDLITYLIAMFLLIFVGMLGTYFHIRADLTAGSLIIPERFLRGAPFMSPLLFANMGILGILAALSPKELDLG
jgi:hypothetical protein